MKEELYLSAQGKAVKVSFILRRLDIHQADGQHGKK